MASLNYDKLYKLNKTGDILVQSLSPGISDHNLPLFRSDSGDVERFRRKIKSRDIDIIGESYPELDEKIQSAREKIMDVIKNADLSRKPRYDLDFARIIHEHFDLPLRAVHEFDFWRCLNLFFFIELSKWRWESNPEDPSKWFTNAAAIFRRSTGYSLNDKEWKKNKNLVYDTRNKRIDVFRFWFIGNKLYDDQKGYYYLEKISEKYKKQDGPLQDFLNQLEGNNLLSEQDRIAKIMAESILLGGREFSETEMRNCFNRYNAFTKRLLMVADKDIIRKEICMLE